MKLLAFIHALWAFFTSLQLASAIDLNLSDAASIQAAASTAASDLMSFYQNANSNVSYEIGLFPYPPIYWWESGAIWGGMIDYWAYTHDDTYLNTTLNAISAQLGPTFDFNMTQQIFDTGNDDQAFWGFDAVTALEYGFPAASSPAPSWLQIAENVFNDFVGRWDTSTCNGGLTWQIYPQNVNGLTYKNAISNGGAMQIAARLARYTGNQFYADWADKIWQWEQAVGLIDPNYNVYDGTDDSENCTGVDHIQWTYNIAVHLYGAAIMYNYTYGTPDADTWGNRTAGILNACATFFDNNIMYEQACEPYNCDTDQYSFKAYMSRWLAKSSIVAPAIVSQQAYTWLSTSAQAAAQVCTGGVDGTLCGQVWTNATFDNSTGPGQQLSAMETFLSLMVNQGPAPAIGANVTLQYPGGTLRSSSSSSSATLPSSTTSSTTIGTATGSSAAGYSVPTTASDSSSSVTSSAVDPAGSATTQSSPDPATMTTSSVGTAADPAASVLISGSATVTEAPLMTATGSPPPASGLGDTDPATQTTVGSLSQAQNSASPGNSTSAGFTGGARSLDSLTSAAHAVAMALALVVILTRSVAA